MNIVLADGSSRTLDEGSSVYNAAKSISIGLAKKAVAGEVNGKLVDLEYILQENDKLKIITESDAEGLEILRHSTAHLMAQAVQRLYKNVKVTIGPVIKDGFFYDFDTGDMKFTPEDLEKIEKEMAKIAAEKIEVHRKVLTKDEAKKVFNDMGENYKIELIDAIEDPTVSIYEQGDFMDLCRGPHIDNTAKIKHYKLLNVAGAYWRGDEKNPQLQRIYGTSWFKKDELDAYLHMLEEAKKRDHRKIGKELKLFMVEDEIGAGFPIYLPKGGILRAVLEEYERKEHLKRGYDIVYGPAILKSDMWKRSGHYENYGENMYFTKIDEVEFGIKPMNCVNHIMVYKSDLRSYRDLPIKLFELGTVHRHEKSGVLHGLMRVRAFTQDDAHVFCTPEQLNEEIVKIIDFVTEVMGVFGFEFEIEVSTKPEKYIGSDDNWEKATAALFAALEIKKIPYTINEGDGAFYGPKIDIKLKDAIGRFWQCATIQADFNLPERFDLSYIGEDGQKHRPIMLHRVILGSVDRFIGVLTEHFAGSFPLWIAPVQVKIMNITDDSLAMCKEVEAALRAEGFRVEKDYRNEKINFKIREAQLEKVPHMVILGKSEVENNTLTVRLRDGENKNNLDLSAYISVLKGLDNNKSLELWR